MGTRSTVRFYSEHAEESAPPIVCIYQQYDGYISGVGHELAAFLNGIKIINGIGSGQNTIGEFANGMGCLAAQYIAKFKERVGGLYITDLGDSEDYDYKVRLTNGQLIIEVDDLFKGTPTELLAFSE